MALLRSALSFGVGHSRALLGGVSQLGTASLGAFGQPEKEDDKRVAAPDQAQLRSFAASAHATPLLRAHQQVGLSSPAAAAVTGAIRMFSSSRGSAGAAASAARALGPLLSHRLPGGSSLPAGLAGSSSSRQRVPHSMAQAQQVRRINAWSPAQRYFVEGDHVITAEANRTIQFTGLDGGSFYPFVVYTAVATVIAAAFMIIPWVVAPARVDLDKSSAYECGFDAFGEARQTFSVSFYLVSIMYLLFDIEIAYLFPYVMCHANAPMFWTMNLFLGILVAGFVYEWGVGALEWRDSEADVRQQPGTSSLDVIRDE